MVLAKGILPAVAGATTAFLANKNCAKNFAVLPLSIRVFVLDSYGQAFVQSYHSYAAGP